MPAACATSSTLTSAKPRAANNSMAMSVMCCGVVERRLPTRDCGTIGPALPFRHSMPYSDDDCDHDRPFVVETWREANSHAVRDRSRDRSRPALRPSSSPRPWLKRCPSTACAGSTDRDRARRAKSQTFDPDRGWQLAPAGGGSARAVRRAALSLRHAQAVVSEESHHPHGGAVAGRPSRCPVRLPGRRGRRFRTGALPARAGCAGRIQHAGAPGGHD